MMPTPMIQNQEKLLFLPFSYCLVENAPRDFVAPKQTTYGRIDLPKLCFLDGLNARFCKQ